MPGIRKLDLPDGVRYIIPAERYWRNFLTRIFSLFLSLLALGAAYYHLASEPVSGTIYLLLAIVYLVLTVTALGWYIGGKETIGTAGGNLLWIRKAFGVGWTRSFPLAAIRELTVVGLPSRSRYSLPWGEIWGRVRIDLGDETHDMGLKISEAQAGELIAGLTPYVEAAKAPLPAAAASLPVPAPGGGWVQPEAELPAPASAPLFSPVAEAHCMHCQKPLAPQARFCGECGREAVVQPAPPSPVPAPGPDSGMQPGAGRPVPPVVSAVVAADAADAAAVPGNMWSRLAAYFADASLVWIVALGLYYALTLTGQLEPGESDTVDRMERAVLELVVALGYMSIAQTVWHTTLGKYALGLELRSSTRTRPYPGFGAVLLRETIGKICSGIAFGLGFLWGFGDRRKQTWHDHMADTVVVRRATDGSVRKQLIALCAAASLVCGAVGVHRGWKEIHERQTATARVDFKAATKDCSDAKDRLLAAQSAPVPDGNWLARQERARTIRERVNAYDQQLDGLADVLDHILQNRLYADDDWFHMYSDERRATQLRKEINQKVLREVDIILGTSPDAADFAGKVSMLQMLDNEVASIDGEINKLEGPWLSAEGE